MRRLRAQREAAPTHPVDAAFAESPIVRHLTGMLEEDGVSVPPPSPDHSRREQPTSNDVSTRSHSPQPWPMPQQTQYQDVRLSQDDLPTQPYGDTASPSQRVNRYQSPQPAKRHHLPDGNTPELTNQHDHCQHYQSLDEDSRPPTAQRKARTMQDRTAAHSPTRSGPQHAPSTPPDDDEVSSR